MIHRDARRGDGSPRGVLSPESSLRSLRLTSVTFMDPLITSGIAAYEDNGNNEDYASPLSTSNYSPIIRYNNTPASAATGGTSALSASYSGMDENGESNFKVVIRVRPPLPRELDGYRPFVDVVRIPKDNRSITLCETLDTEDGRGGVYSRQSFTFDNVYDRNTPQRVVYECSAQPAVLSILEGYNATLIAYGQTGTGKTYTMEGFTSEEQRGIIPRAVEEVFIAISASQHEDKRFLVRASYMQIYNEVISDLLKPLNNNNVGCSSSSSSSGNNNANANGNHSNSSTARALTVRHNPQRGVYVEGLSEWIVRSPNDVYILIERGTQLRATSTTKLSELSSRSHAMFTITVEVISGDENGSSSASCRVGKLHIVDLAGSEKVRQAGVSGQRLEETKKINRSLHELGNVIAALACKSGGRARHVPFRNSVLTSALRDSLGGNCKTTLIACISPALESYTESLSTLVFANRAKNIKNTAYINENVDQATLLRQYEQELKRLRQQLQERGGVDTGLVTALRRAEERIEELEIMRQSNNNNNNNNNSGGVNDGVYMAEEYALRLDELDRERQLMVEDKAQVDRYKQLLLKQRDIMLNLTTRLNERDEAILLLQEEVDAYDAHVQMLEDTLDALQQQCVGSNPNDKSTASFSLPRTQAEKYMRQARVGPHGGSVSTEGRHRSDMNPTSAHLTAESRTDSLTSASPVVESTGNQRNDGGIAVNDEVKRQVTELVQERAETIIRRLLDEQVWQLGCEMESLQDQLQTSEQKRQLLEELIDASKTQQPNFPDVIARARCYIDEQQEMVRKAYEARIHALQQQLAQEREQRMRLSSDVDTLGVEVRKALESSTTAAQRAEVNDICEALQRVEEHIQRETRHSIENVVARAIAMKDNNKRGKDNENGTGNHDYMNQNHTFQHPATGGLSSSSFSLPSPTTATVRALETQLQQLQSYHASREEEWRHVLREKEAALRQLEERVGGGGEEKLTALTKSLYTHVKDRRALKTIMEQRIKVKTDAICELLAADPQLQQQQERHSLFTEARALQNLVNASIKAMDSWREIT